MATYLTDPYTQVYNALWDLLEAQTGLTKKVRFGNRIKLTGDNPQPYRREALNADFPELVIEPVSGGEITYSSTAIMIGQNFTIGIASGDLRLQKQAFPLKWEIIKALYKTRGNLDLDFVTQVRLRDLTEMRLDEQSNRGASGWVVAIGVSVDMCFPTTDLQE